MVKKITILGSTGSVGCQALDIVRAFPESIKVVGLAAGRNWQLLAEQAKEFRPEVLSVFEEDDLRELGRSFSGQYKPQIFFGQKGLETVATHPDADTVLAAVTGIAGLIPVVAAINAGKKIALANKETLVAGGEYVMELVRRREGSILPVDSEHSAVWQCTRGACHSQVGSIILTASGGPFRDTSVDLSNVTVEMALKHPNWEMGKKITVDSATMMNKGLEIIEARWLFNIEYERIKVVVHPESIIHSMVEFIDGSVLAQMSLPDMRLPIQLALLYPERKANNLPRLNWESLSRLTIEPVDTTRFPSVSLAYFAGKIGGSMPCVLNAANEVAVEAFLNRRLGFREITKVVEQVMNSHNVVGVPSLEEILDSDRWARERAEQEIGRL